MYQNKNILVLGMARSGVAVSKLLVKYNNKVTLSDMKKQDPALVKELEDLGIKVVITDKQEDLVNDSFDIIVKNPAIKRTVASVVKAKSLGLPVINEVEVSYKLIPKECPIITVTGSNTITVSESAKLIYLNGSDYTNSDFNIYLQDLTLTITKSDETSSTITVLDSDDAISEVDSSTIETSGSSILCRRIS